MTKKKVREATEATAFHSPFFSLSDVATQYALDHKMYALDTRCYRICP